MQPVQQLAAQCAWQTTAQLQAEALRRGVRCLLCWALRLPRLWPQRVRRQPDLNFVVWQRLPNIIESKSTPLSSNHWS